MSQQQKVAIVTGASQGIGAAIVKALRPLVAGLDQPGGAERDPRKATSLLVRFGQRMKKK